jgi:hypothetical protein
MSNQTLLADNLVPRPWSSEDLDFFLHHPERSYRLRRAHPNEAEETQNWIAGDHPDGYIACVLVCAVDRGVFHQKVFVWLDPTALDAAYASEPLCAAMYLLMKDGREGVTVHEVAELARQLASNTVAGHA